MDQFLVSAPIEIPMRNDIGGVVAISISQISIKFSNWSKARLFKIDAFQLWAKIKGAEDQFDLGGLDFHVNSYMENGIAMTGILIIDSCEDCDQAVVTTYDLREKALYYFVG